MRGMMSHVRNCEYNIYHLVVVVYLCILHIYSVEHE
jgi:hypothetical protein